MHIQLMIGTSCNTLSCRKDLRMVQELPWPPLPQGLGYCTS
jgi:hypothetical protein